MLMALNSFIKIYLLQNLEILSRFSLAITLISAGAVSSKLAAVEFSLYELCECARRRWAVEAVICGDDLIRYSTKQSAAAITRTAELCNLLTN